MTPEPAGRPYTVTTSGPGQVVWHNGADGTTAAELVAHQGTGSALPTTTTAADRARAVLAFAEALTDLVGRHGDELTIAGAHAPVGTVDVIAPCTMGDQPSIGVELCDGRRYLLTVEAVDE